MSQEGTLMSKIRERRKKLGESMAETSRGNETSDMELTPRTNRAMMDILSEDGGILGADDDDAYLSSSSREPLDEILDAKKLVDDLTERREETRKELERTLKEDDEKPTPSKRTKGKAAKLEVEDETKPKKKKRVKKGKKEETDDTQITEGEDKEQKDLMSMDEAVMAAKSGTGSVNLNQSIRDRLKKKMSQMKEQAAEESKEEESTDVSKVSGKPPTRRLRGMRGKQLATRFDEPMSEDEKKLHETIEAKTQWQKVRKALKAKESSMPSAEESFDFFTKVFEPEPEVKPTIKAGTSKETEEDEESQKEKKRQEEEEKEIEEKPVEDTTEDEPLLGGDYFADIDEWRFNPYEVKPAQYTPYKDVVDREMKVYFRPSVATVPDDQKVPENQEPRYLEDEGFYVGIRPPVERRNVNIEEQRLIMRPDKGSKWFGDDGRIKALPDPLKDLPTRPPVIEPEDIDPYIQTDYKKAYVVDFDSRFIDGLGESYGRFQLDVDVNAVTFTHHSLFSKEHVLASKLQQLWTQYLLRNQKNMTEFLTDRLQALKEAVIHLKKQIHNLIKNADVTFVEEHQTRLQDYKYEIRQTRKLRDGELHNDRQLLKHILKTWKEMKALRESQGCTNTPCKLTVRKEDSVKDDDTAEWNKEIEDEVDEQREGYEQEYNQQMKQYKLAKDEYDRLVKIKDTIKKRKKRRKKRGSQENLADSDAGEQTEDESLPQPQQPPYEFNEKEMKMKIRTKFNEMRRKPGEPRLYPELSNSAVITPTHNCPKAEQARRRDLQRCQCFVRVLFNDKEVSRTTSKSLTSDFTVHFGDIFNIQIVQWPENIRLEVVESSGFSSTVLAQVFIAIPDAQVTTKNVQLEELEFSSDQKVAFSHQGVGSGHPFKIGDENNAQEYTLLTSGTLVSCVSWGVGDDGSPLIPPISQTTAYSMGSVKQYDALAAIGATGMVDMEKLSQWITEAKLDPNDPANAALLHMIKSVSGTDAYGKSVRLPTYFRLEQLQQEFDFATEDEIAKSKRFKLIELRQKEVPEFRNYTQIPIKKKKVPTATLR